jgi:hypothetical protein
MKNENCKMANEQDAPQGEVISSPFFILHFAFCILHLLDLRESAASPRQS